MSTQDVEKDRIMHELLSCQLRVNELEKTAAAAHEQELKAARGEFESLFELSPDALVLVDRQGKIARVNTAAERLFGYTREELVGGDHDSLIVPDKARARHDAEMKRFMQNPRVRVMGMGLELRGRRKDGSEFAADIDLGPLEIGKDFFVLAVVRDATRRKRLEEDLQESEKRYRDLVELSPDGIVVHSGGLTVFSNAAAARLLGLGSAEQTVGRSIGDFIHPEYQATANQRIRQTTDEGKMAPVVQGKFVRADGTVFFADVISMPYSHQGKPATLSILRDVTQRKLDEDAIREQQERFRTIVRTALDGFWINDLEGRLLDVNDSYCRLIGYSREELLRMRITDVEAAESPEDTRAHLQQMKRTGGDRFETRHRRKDGVVIDIEVSANYLEGDGGRLFVFLRDITERKRAEQTLRESEEKYRSLFTSMSAGYAYCRIVTDAQNQPDDFVCLEVNDAFERLTGLKKADVIGRGMTEAIPTMKQANPEIIPAYGKVALTGEPTSFEVFFEPFQQWYLISAYSPKRGYFVILFDNITQRKQLEAELDNYRWRLETVVAQRTAEFAQANEKLSKEIEEHRKSEEGLALRATILDNAREAVFLLNQQGDFVYANEAAIRTYGYSRDEFLTMNLRQLLRPEDAAVIDERIKATLKLGHLEAEAVHVKKDRSLMPVEVRHSLIKTLHGQFIVSVMRDATTRFRLRSLLTGMPVMLWTTDPQLKLTSTTGAALETLGLERDDGVGLGLGEFLESNGLAGDVLTAHEKALEGKMSGFRFESKKMGRSFRGWVAPLPDIGGETIGTIGTAMEIPE